MVVSLYAGRDAVRAYVTEQADQGLAHVRNLVEADRDSIVAAIVGLSEEEGNRVTLEGEWTPAQVLAHLNPSLARSKARLEAMSSGREWVNPPSTGGQGSDAQKPFVELRREYIEGMQAIIDVLERADETKGRNLTADHIDFGPFDWLQWAVYSHHVHTADHIGQLGEARSRVRGNA
jgi:hypothetical protein